MNTSMRAWLAGLALLTSFATGASTAVKESKLSNGAPFLTTLDAAPSRQIVTVIFETGCQVLPKGHAASGYLIEYMLQEGPLGQSIADYRRELFLLNASINASAVGRAFYLVIAAPPATLKAALQKSSELLQKPKLTAEQLQVGQQKAVSRRRAEQQDARLIVDLAAQRHLYGRHPDAYPCTSPESEIAKLGLDDVKNDWAALTQRSRLTFGTVGPMAAAKVGTLIEDTFVKPAKVQYQAAPVAPLATFPKPTSATGTDVVLVEQPGAEDNQVMFLWPQSLPPDSAEFATAEVAMTLLGGGFTGRLQQELREKRGLTYGAYSYITDTLPEYVAASFAGGENIGRLIQELPQVYQSFLDEEQSEERLGIAKEALVTSIRESTELPLDGFLRSVNARFFGRDINSWRGHAERTTAVSIAGVKQFIKARMNSRPSYLVLVGDPAALLPALQQAGYPKEAIKTLKAEDL